MADHGGTPCTHNRPEQRVALKPHCLYYRSRSSRLRLRMAPALTHCLRACCCNPALELIYDMCLQQCAQGFRCTGPDGQTAGGLEGTKTQVTSCTAGADTPAARGSVYSRQPTCARLSPVSVGLAQSLLASWEPTSASSKLVLLRSAPAGGCGDQQGGCRDHRGGGSGVKQGAGRRVGRVCEGG